MSTVANDIVKFEKQIEQILQKHFMLEPYVYFTLEHSKSFIPTRQHHLSPTEHVWYKDKVC